MTVNFLLDWMAEALFQDCDMTCAESLSLSDQEPFLWLAAFADRRRNSFPTFVSLNGTTIPKCKQIREHILLYPACISLFSSTKCCVLSVLLCRLQNLMLSLFSAPSTCILCPRFTRVLCTPFSCTSPFPGEAFPFSLSGTDILLLVFKFQRKLFLLMVLVSKEHGEGPVMDCARKAESEWV